MATHPELSALGTLVRRHDPDRFLATLFAPPQRRETLFALYAFNNELARAREAASNPTLALIRLQWWREVVEGARRRHEVAGPLLDAVEAGALDRGVLLEMIAGRETEAEPAIPTLDAWKDYLRATAGGVMEAAGRALGAPQPCWPALRARGAAYGAAGVLRSIRVLARHGRCLLPADVLAAHGMLPESVTANPDDPALNPVVARLAAEGRALLAEGAQPRPPRRALAAILPAVLARRDLAPPGPPRTPRPRGLADRLAVILAGLGGRLRP